MPYLDLSSDPTPPKPLQHQPIQQETEQPVAGSRRFIGVKFNCCHIYVHIYVNRDGSAYEGRCPKCFKLVKLAIGEGGTNVRFFEAY